MPINKILTHLSGVKNSSNNRWTAKCPAHDDRSPSLSIRQNHDGSVLMHCHSGCDIEDIVGAIGLKLADLYPKNCDYKEFTKKPSYPLDDVKKALKYEIYIITTAAAMIVNKEHLSQTDYERVNLAAERIIKGMDYGN